MSTAGLAPTDPPVNNVVGVPTPFITGGAPMRDAFVVSPQEIVSGNYVPGMARNVLNEAATMVGFGQLPNAPLGLGQQAPGMQPSTALAYANSTFREGLSQGHTDHKRVAGRNLYPGHLLFALSCPQTHRVGCEDDFIWQSNILKTLESSNATSDVDKNFGLKNAPIRGFNLSDLNCELYRRQSTPGATTGVPRSWRTHQQFEAENPYFVRGYIDTSASKNTIGSNLVQFTKEPGLKDCDILCRGIGLTGRHSVFGSAGVPGDQGLFIAVRMPMDHAYQERMKRHTLEYMASMQKVHNIRRDGVLNLAGRDVHSSIVRYRDMTTPYDLKKREPYPKAAALVSTPNTRYVWQVIGWAAPKIIPDGLLLDPVTGRPNFGLLEPVTFLTHFDSVHNAYDPYADPKATIFSQAAIEHQHNIAMEFYGGQHTDYGGSMGGKEPNTAAGEGETVRLLITPEGFKPKSICV